MLFSREDVSSFINQHFEPAWEMVRPVPIVRIDFGDGQPVTRTLHGNVASYVCCADGQVVDILPGIYTPAAYTASLQPLYTLAGDVSLQANRLTRLRSYHRDRAQSLRGAGPGGNSRPNLERDIGKKVIEKRVERIFAQVQVPPNNTGVNTTRSARPRTAAELANWQPLAADTRLNETERRLLIHQHLANADPVRPDQIKSWLYRDVLHADLADPYLGLGDDFFADIEG